MMRLPLVINRRNCSSKLATQVLVLLIAVCFSRAAKAEEVLPKHMNQETLKAIRAGLDFLARTQNSDGGWNDAQDGRAYPIAVSSLAGMALLANGNTPTRGRYAPQVKELTEYLLKNTTASGLITGPGQERGQPMHGHGFALMYLACVYGMESKESLRQRTREAIDRAVKLTAEGQSAEGGWSYTPGSGDEGSVTVTQVQALRAVHNAGLHVPRGTIEKSVQYIQRCSTPEGGISYSLSSGGSARLPISAAAIATLYNAGQYDAPVATRCLDFVWQRLKGRPEFNSGEGHAFYMHLYASQGFYMSGDKYWDEYFPARRDQLLAMQNRDDGSWVGDGVGRTYGTGIALIILQLPYKYLPVFQR